MSTFRLQQAIKEADDDTLQEVIDNLMPVSGKNTPYENIMWGVIDAIESERTDRVDEDFVSIAPSREGA